MIGVLSQGRVRIKIRIGIRVRVGVTFDVSIYHWSNCRRSKCRTFLTSYLDHIFYVDCLYGNASHMLVITW